MAPVSTAVSRNVKPGDIVVSLGEIIDKLGGKLSQNDIDELMRAILSKRKGEVRPGDLITADLMNQILAELADLAKKVAFLESSVGKEGDVVISGFDPEDGNVKVGDPLKVLGKNFQYTEGLARVYVDRYPIGGFFPESTDEVLSFKIPLEIIDVPAEGRPSVLTVQNNSSRAQAIIFLRPAMTLAGFFELNEVDTRPSAATPTGSQPLTMEYEVVSHVNLDTTVKLKANVTGPTNAADWQKNVTILNADETVNAESKLAIAQSERKRFLVRINPIPQGTASGIAFSLEARVIAGNVFAKRAVGFTVGTAYGVPDNTITLNFASGEIRPTGARGSVDATGIQVAAGAGVKVVFSGTFEQAGKYDLTITVPTGWKSQFTDGTLSPVEVAANEVAAGAKAVKILHFTVWPDVNPAGSGELVLKLQRQDRTTVRTSSMNVKLLS